MPKIRTFYTILLPTLVFVLQFSLLKAQNSIDSISLDKTKVTTTDSSDKKVAKTIIYIKTGTYIHGDSKIVKQFKRPESDLIKTQKKLTNNKVSLPNKVIKKNKSVDTPPINRVKIKIQRNSNHQLIYSCAYSSNNCLVNNNYHRLNLVTYYIKDNNKIIFYKAGNENNFHYTLKHYNFLFKESYSIRPPPSIV